jgi:hypothetical protein
METEMTPVEIKAEADRIAELCAAKGYYNPKITVYINWIGYDMTVNLCYRTDAHSGLIDKFFHGSCDAGIEALFADAEQHVADLKSIDDAKRDAFIAAVGKLIDHGKDIGIEVAFLNPLTAMMETLSSNIITHQ